MRGPLSRGPVLRVARAPCGPCSKWPKLPESADYAQNIQERFVYGTIVLTIHSDGHSLCAPLTRRVLRSPRLRSPRPASLQHQLVKVATRIRNDVYSDKVMMILAYVRHTGILRNEGGKYT